MSNQECRWVFFSPGDPDVDANSARESRDAVIFGNNLIPDDQLWLQNFQSIPIEEAHYNILNDPSSFTVPSSLPFQQANSTETQGLQEIVGSSLEKGQSSGTKRKHDSDPLDMQGMESQDEAGVEGLSEKSQKSIQIRQTSSTEARKLNQRLRRQKLNEKLKALQELIPNCNKRDIVSTLDNAIKYIKTMQHQFQEQQMLMQACYSSPLIPQPMQQGMWIPFLAPFLQAGPFRGGMGMPGMFNFPMTQLGLPDPHLFTSLASSELSTLGGLSASNPGDHVLEPLPLATCSGLQCMTTTGETSLSQGDISSIAELSDYPCYK